MTPFDVITANPPYISEGQMPHLLKSVQREPDVALRGGPTGLEPTLRIIHDAPGVLRPGGMLALETGLGMADAVCDLFNKSGRFEGLRILKDATDIERTVVGLRKP
jgi:release factor glutamine methyltransferase